MIVGLAIFFADCAWCVRASIMLSQIKGLSFLCKFMDLCGSGLISMMNFIFIQHGIGCSPPNTI